MKMLFSLALFIPTIAAASASFDGTWKIRTDSTKVTGKPDVYDLSNGMYDCKSCKPPYKIKADGSDQPVPGHDYVDQTAVKIIDASTVEFTDKKDGKVVSRITMSVSSDGSTLTGKYTNNVGDKPVTGSLTEKRVAPGAAAAHAMSGSWMQDSMSDMSDLGRTVTLQSTPNGMKTVWNGQTTDAKFDGKEYAVAGDPGKTMVTLRKVSETQIEETDRRRGMVVDKITWTLAADGKTIAMQDIDPVHESKTAYVMEKQP